MSGRMWVAMAATLAVLLSVLGNVAANTISLSAQWTIALWVLLGLMSVAAVIIAVRQHRIDQRRVSAELTLSGLGSPEWLAARVLFLVGGRLPKVGEVNLLQLRVKPAIGTNRADGADMPPYVPRDVDADLEWAINSGGFVLLHGRAAVGKSRAAAEALRRLRPDHSLVVPVDGRALRELVQSGYHLGEAVIWLDDLERFVAADGLDLALLQQLCPSASNRVAVIATIRDNELAAFDAASAKRDSASGIDRAVIDLLAQVRDRRRIAVARHLSTSERTAAHGLGGRDGRIGRAVRADEGFAEYLAAGTAMMDHWSIGDGPRFQVGQAIISAAVDCRRAGYHRPIPAATLTALHCQYLSPGWRDRSDLPCVEEALAWASQPLLGASSCLQPRANRSYLASDYLLDRAQTGASPLCQAPIPEKTWRTLIELSTPEDAFGVGLQAYYAMVLDIAELAFTKATESGDAKAPNSLGILLTEQGRFADAEARYRQAIEAGDVCALLNLANLCRAQGHLRDAETWYCRAVAAGDQGALVSLAVLLADQGRWADAESCYRRAAAAGNVTALLNLGFVVAEQGRPDEAERCYRRAADAGDTTALIHLGVLLAGKNRYGEAEICYRQAIDAGNLEALDNLCAILTEQGRLSEAQAYCRTAIQSRRGKPLS